MRSAVQNAVIVVSGMPGSGKSTLGRSLSAALDVPFLDKDEILERLFEMRGVGDTAWRQELSRAGDEELIRSVEASDGVVVSSLWRGPGTSATSGTAVEWLAALNRPVVEIFCLCDVETAASRFKSRKRHPGHLDASRSSQQLLDQLHRLADAGPLRVGELIVVDTRTELDIDDVARRIRAKVEEINASMSDMRQREILRTARLVLRTTSESDVLPLHQRIFSDADVAQFVFAGKKLSFEESARFIHENFNFAGGDIGLSTLVERDSGELIGFSGLEACGVLGSNDLELGFVLAKNAWRKGYASEIGRAQIDFGFRHLRQERLLALVHPDNVRSIRVIEKLGMRRETDLLVEGRGHRYVYCIEA